MDVPSLEVLQREIAAHRISALQHTPVDLVRLDSSAKSYRSCFLLKLSPLGFRVISQEQDEIDTQWLGAPVEARILLSDTQTLVQRGVVVSVTSNIPGTKEVAVRTTQHEYRRVQELERRRQTRWLCSDEFHPTGVASNPAKANDFILFRILDVSPSGLRLLTSLRNNFIVRGMRLDVIVSFPMVSQISVRLTVQNVSFISRGDKEFLAIGAKIDDLTKTQSSVIAQYMAQFGDVDSLREFRDSGFAPFGINESIEYSVVRTEADYREVLNLRHLAYLADNKIAKSAKVNDVADIHDSRARILICKFRGKTIATARLTFHEIGDVTEHEEFIPWSNELPRRDESVEVTRACTHPDFRRTGLFFALIRYVVITATQAGRSWVVTSSTEDLVPMYRFVGLSDMGITYNHPDLNDLKHFVLVANMYDALSGRSVGVAAWSQVWRDAFPYMSPNAVAQDTVSRARIALYRLLGPLVGPIGSVSMRLKLSLRAIFK